ncbi:MAG: O-antigen ligase family protein [Nitrospiraceae bacterium]
MRAPGVTPQWPVLAIAIVLAVALSLVVAFTKPSISLTLLVGAIPLVIAFLSPLAGLYILVFSMLLGPEFLVGGMGSGATLGRGVTLRFDDMLLLLVGLAWLARVAVSKQETAYVYTPLNRPIIFYIGACLLATLMGILSGRVRPTGGFFFLLKYYEYFFLYFMTVNLVKTEKQIKHLVTASLVTCLLVALYAISQIPSGVRVSAPFEGQEGEPNTLGGYLVFMMAILSGMVVTSGAVSRKWPVLIFLGICGIALQATLSRASFLAMGIVLLGVLFVTRRRSPLLVAVVLLGLTMIPFIVPKAVTDRMLHTFTQAQEEGQIHVGKLRVDTSTSDRLRSWHDSFEIWKKSPLWGQGVTGGPFMDAMYPRVLTEAGLLGVCAFTALLWAIFRTGLAGVRQFQDPYMQAITVGFLIGFVALLAHAVGSNTFIIVRIMEPFWLYAGLIVRGLMLLSPVHSPEQAPHPSTGYRDKRGIAPISSRGPALPEVGAA